MAGAKNQIFDPTKLIFVVVVPAPTCTVLSNRGSECPGERTKIEPKSTKNRPEIDPNRSRGSSGRSGAIRGASGVLPGRSGRRSESSRDTPGAPRDAPGRPRDPPERPKSEPGRSRVDFWERSFRTVVRETLPERFSDDFRVPRGGRDTQSARHGAYGLHVGRFSPTHPLDPENDRKLSENGPRTVPPSAPNAPKSRLDGQSERRARDFFLV